jgi:hypothetical protein
MTRRIALASFYTLFVVVLLAAWPSSHSDHMSVISTLPIARWLVLLIPCYWGWVALGFENAAARRISIAGAAILLVAIFFFIVDQDTRFGSGCLWDSPGCGTRRWF